MITPDKLLLLLDEGMSGFFECKKEIPSVTKDELRLPTEGGTLVFHMFMKDNAGSWYFESTN